MTSADLYKVFQDKIDAVYTSYWSDEQANRFFMNMIYVCTEKKNLTENEQRVFDELANLITTQKTYQVNNNKIGTAPIAITNITSVGLTVTIDTYFDHNLVLGDNVLFTGVQGLTPFPISATPVTAVISPTRFSIVVVFPLVGAYVAGSGSITHAKMIGDYMHIYAAKTTFVEPQFGLVVNRTNGTSPINIYFNTRNKFRDSSMIQLSNMALTPAANGTYFTKYLNHTGVSLYTDADLQVPSTGGNSTTQPQGNISMIWEEQAKPLFSDEKIDPFEETQGVMPRFETADKFIKFYPLNRKCTQAIIDYIKTPPMLFTDIGGNKVAIDVRDTVIDLALYYPLKYLYFMVDVAVRIVSTPLRDVLLNQSINQEIVMNP